MPITVVMALGECQVLDFLLRLSARASSWNAFKHLVVMKVAVNILKLGKHKNQLNCAIKKLLQ